MLVLSGNSAEQAMQKAKNKLPQRKNVRILAHIPPDSPEVYRNRHRMRIEHRLEQTPNTKLALMILSIIAKDRYENRSVKLCSRSAQTSNICYVLLR